MRSSLLLLFAVSAVGQTLPNAPSHDLVQPFSLDSVITERSHTTSPGMGPMAKPIQLQNDVSLGLAFTWTFNRANDRLTFIGGYTATNHTEFWQGSLSNTLHKWGRRK